MQNSFVQHAANVAMAGHATRSGTTDLGNRADRLRVVFRDHRPDFAFSDVQTMTHRPIMVGVIRILGESLLTEVHGKSLNRTRRAGS